MANRAATFSSPKDTWEHTATNPSIHTAVIHEHSVVSATAKKVSATGALIPRPLAVVLKPVEASPRHRSVVSAEGSAAATPYRPRGGSRSSAAPRRGTSALTNSVSPRRASATSTLPPTSDRGLASPDAPPHHRHHSGGPVRGRRAGEEAISGIPDLVSTPSASSSSASSQFGQPRAPGRVAQSGGGTDDITSNQREGFHGSSISPRVPDASATTAHHATGIAALAPVAVRELRSFGGADVFLSDAPPAVSTTRGGGGAGVALMSKAALAFGSIPVSAKGGLPVDMSTLSVPRPAIPPRRSLMSGAGSGRPPHQTARVKTSDTPGFC